MTDTLRIEFSPDMPVAAVEVVGPDLRVVTRTMLSAGKSKDVDVPSGLSFLRVHLPSGRVVTLDDPGNLKRVVSRASLAAPLAATAKEADAIERAATDAYASAAGKLSAEGDDASDAGGGMVELMEDDEDEERQLRRRVRQRIGRPRGARQTFNDEPLALRGGAQVRIIGDAGIVGTSRRRGAELNWQIQTPWTKPPLELRYIGPTGDSIGVALPASTIEANVRHERVPDSPDAIRVTLTTQSQHADAILSFMSQGDMHSAEALSEWTDEAEQMVYRDDSDPYSGAIFQMLAGRMEVKLQQTIFCIAHR